MPSCNRLYLFLDDDIVPFIRKWVGFGFPLSFSPHFRLSGRLLPSIARVELVPGVAFLKSKKKIPRDHGMDVHIYDELLS